MCHPIRPYSERIRVYEFPLSHSWMDQSNAQQNRGQRSTHIIDWLICLEFVLISWEVVQVNSTWHLTTSRCRLLYGSRLKMRTHTHSSTQLEKNDTTKDGRYNWNDEKTRNYAQQNKLNECYGKRIEFPRLHYLHLSCAFFEMRLLKGRKLLT